MSSRSLVFVILVGMVLFQTTSSIASPYSGAWEPEGGIVITFDSSLFSIRELSFSLYDFDNPSQNLKLFNDGVFSTRFLFFSQDSDQEWYVGFTPGAHTLALGDSPEFGLSFNCQGTFYDSYDLLKINPYLYQITWDDAAGKKSWNVYLAGGSPVPIPTSAVLLGSGLLVLAGLGLRRRKAVKAMKPVPCWALETKLSSVIRAPQRYHPFRELCSDQDACRFSLLYN